MWIGEKDSKTFSYQNSLENLFGKQPIIVGK
jgi:hypothetical protein